MDISVVIPLFNEVESLPELYRWIREVMDRNRFSYELLFIDDGSNDGSWQWIEQQSAINPTVKGVVFCRSYVKSAALHTGFDAARGDVVITMDADLQDSPEEIPGLFQMVKEEGYDLVSGWKKKRYDNTFAKNIPSRIYNATARRFTGVKLHDMNCGLKAYRREVVKSIEVYGEMHRYIPVIAMWAGFTRIGEKVVVHQKRKFGVTKFGLSRFIFGYLDLMSILFISKFGKRPMHLFGTLGSLMFLLGFLSALWLGAYKLYHLFNGVLTGRVTESPYFYIALTLMIIGTQLFLTGFIGELVSRTASERNTYLIDKQTNL